MNRRVQAARGKERDRLGWFTIPATATITHGELAAHTGTRPNTRTHETHTIKRTHACLPDDCTRPHVALDWQAPATRTASPPCGPPTRHVWLRGTHLQALHDGACQGLALRALLLLALDPGVLQRLLRADALMWVPVCARSSRQRLLQVQHGRANTRTSTGEHQPGGGDAFFIASRAEQVKLACCPGRRIPGIGPIWKELCYSAPPCYMLENTLWLWAASGVSPAARTRFWQTALRGKHTRAHAHRQGLPAPCAHLASSLRTKSLAPSDTSSHEEPCSLGSSVKMDFL